MAVEFEELFRERHAGLFWNVDPAKIDPLAHASFVIRRVVERGNL